MSGGIPDRDFYNEALDHVMQELKSVFKEFVAWRRSGLLVGESESALVHQQLVEETHPNEFEYL